MEDKVKILDWVLNEVGDREWGGQAEAAVGQPTLDVELLVLRRRRHDVMTLRRVADDDVRATPDTVWNDH